MSLKKTFIIFKSCFEKRIQNLLDKKLKAFQNDTYNELNRYGDPFSKLYKTFYQFVVAYKKALEEYYKEFIYS